MIGTYYRLTKPGIIYGNLLTAAAGFLLASNWEIDVVLLLATLAGTSLVIASACVINNIFDRKIDAKMTRTKQRALASGAVTILNAAIYAMVLGIGGFAILALFTNWLVVGIGMIGFVDYVVAYTFSKRYTAFSTVIGSVAGATPITAGYIAVTNHIDDAAWLLFLIMVSWQMAHFYAIAMYRLKDYRAAGLPVWPAKRGLQTTKLQVLIFIGAFTYATSLLTKYGYTGNIFTVVMATFGIIWFIKGLEGLKTDDCTSWAREMFSFSLVVLLSLAVMVSVGAFLP